MAKVSAPYNFVPLNEKVFFPPWANLVNHDVPFKDGLSGQIELEIKAETPIFIRGKEEPNDEDANLKQYRFPKKEDRYYIPGSSIKGEISNILEILSFSKLRFFNDDIFNYRDWDNNELYKKSDFSPNKIKGGWLTRTADGYKIEYSTKTIGRISHKELNKKISNFSVEFSTKFDNKSEEMATAKYKYDFANMNEGFIKFQLFNFSKEERDRKLICSFLEDGNDEGTLVFTGQSSRRKEGYFDKNNKWEKAKGKGYEFVFWKPNKTIEFVKDALEIKNFFLVYNDHKQNEQTEDWKMWKKQLNNGFKVPVFLRIENGILIDFGLSMLYKLLYEKSIKDIIKKNRQHFDSKRDLTETIFGSIDDAKLKGRVQFKHAFSINATESNTPITITLGSPKASYYPFYIKQKFKSNSSEIFNNYLTFNDGEISGRKRYPAIKTDLTNLLNSTGKPSDTTTTFFPLEKGAEFTCKINFHNLIKEELGALLSALTFHGTPNLNHKIGAGKPLGMGNVKVKIESLQVNGVGDSIDNYLCVFEKVMNTQITNWIKKEQLKELVAIATPIEPNEKLKYLILDPDNGINEFSKIKGNPKEKSPKCALPNYSNFIGINPIINTKIKNECALTDINKESLEDQYNNVLNQFKSKTEDRLFDIEAKIDLLKYEIKKAKEVKEREEKRLSKQKVAAKGISELFNDYNPKKDRGQKKFKQIIDRWIKESKEGVILEKDYPFLEKILIIIYNSESKKNKAKWTDNKKQHHILKKLISWIGNEEKANQIFNTVKNI